MDGGEEITKLIESSGEPWRPLSRFIVSDNPQVKHRSISEIQELKAQRDLYRLEYAQRECHPTERLVHPLLTFYRLEFDCR